MAAPTIYKSSDASAPTLTGQVGSLITLLDACLVNGYGSKSAAGWSKAFSGTNAASYKQGAASGADAYLDVNDNAGGAAGAQEANVRGYEAMTAVATGTNPFPTTAQIASLGLYIRKSATANATARGWVVVADDKTFHLFILSGDTAGQYQPFTFGDLYSFKSADAYRCLIHAPTASGGGVNLSGLSAATVANASSTILGGYVARTQAQTGTSLQIGRLGLGTNIYSSPFPGPNAPDGNVYLSRMFISEPSSCLRGYIRGLYQIVTATTGLADGDTFTGATGTDFAGRTFLVLNKLISGTYLAIETSAWDTST